VNAINWSQLTPVQRNRLIALYIMDDDMSTVEPYTQSMDAAMRVVEHFTDAVVNITHVPGAYHHCRIKPFANQRAHHGFRLNAAEAICVAALRAAGLTVIHSEEDIISYHNLRNED
jgi:Phage ABA sandwich domain